MVTSPHFEKARGDVGIVGKCVGGGRGDVGRGMRGGVGKVKGREEMWGSVLGPHTQIHFPTPPPFLSPHANTLSQSPHTGRLSHTPPHTSFLASPHTPTQFSTPPPIPLPTTPYTPTHFPLTTCTLPTSVPSRILTSANLPK